MIALIAAPIALILLGIVAAVAIPVVVNQRARAQWAATSVTLPDTLLDLPRQRQFETQQTSRLLTDAPAGTQFGVYTTGREPVVVVAAVRFSSPQSSVAQRVTWAGFTASLRQAGWDDLRLADRPPGRLGGRLACGTSDTATVCLSTDSAVATMMLALGTVPGGVDALASIRNQVEQRSN